MPSDTQGPLTTRFQDAAHLEGVLETHPAAAPMIERGSCRSFTDERVPDDIVDLICAAALSSPTKSDLQQRDIVILTPDQIAALARLLPDQPWVARAPQMAVFCGNNRRQRLLHDWADVPFANDHFDAVFNAACDAAIALGAFVTTANQLGLGCCPVSAVRNEAEAVSDMLDLPDHVFPVAGLAFGHPGATVQTSRRLPLGQTVHKGRYTEQGLHEAIDAYDAWRAAHQPYDTQRFPDTFGQARTYTWSDDKVRQYSRPERAGFGAFLRAKGFRLD